MTSTFAGGTVPAAVMNIGKNLARFRGACAARLRAGLADLARAARLEVSA